MITILDIQDRIKNEIVENPKLIALAEKLYHQLKIPYTCQCLVLYAQEHNG